MVSFKFPTWFIRVSRHKKCLSEMETNIRSQYETEMITVIKDCEIRKSQLKLQINVLKSFASDSNLAIANHLLETLKERKHQIQELKERTRTLEKYILDRSEGQDSVVSQKIVDN